MFLLRPYGAKNGVMDAILEIFRPYGTKKIYAGQQRRLA